ncbi:slc30a2 protein [Besnoitia besnoiti]|uniref:Slc30a2 protein n=1 Tax=Besnoitia besnoiti TaxID=94643 RepID=A0A2A9M7V7_BESBE|nr:slc30a2 protein [Besnoitia besnoiti]PFH31452.1 slc30a2 protein [Besnoitia besnoiti]
MPRARKRGGGGGAAPAASQSKKLSVAPCPSDGVQAADAEPQPATSPDKAENALPASYPEEEVGVSSAATMVPVSGAPSSCCSRSNTSSMCVSPSRNVSASPEAAASAGPSSRHGAPSADGNTRGSSTKKQPSRRDATSPAAESGSRPSRFSCSSGCTGETQEEAPDAVAPPPSASRLLTCNGRSSRELFALAETTQPCDAAAEGGGGDARAWPRAPACAAMRCSEPQREGGSRNGALLSVHAHHAPEIDREAGQPSRGRCGGACEHEHSHCHSRAQVHAHDEPRHGHEHPLLHSGNQRARQKLVTASMVCCVFMVVELVAGILANSLALMTDASHLLSDLCAFLISLFALWVSELKGNPSMSFGYHRAEILGALLSVLLIWALTAFLIYEACFRVVDPPAVDGRLMFWTAVVGTAANLFMTHILKVHSHGIGHVHSHENECCSSGGAGTGAGSHETAAPQALEALEAGHRLEACLTSAPAEEEMQPRPVLLVERPPSASSAGSTAGDVYVRLEDTLDDKDFENMNLRAAYIHALGDLLQNVGVMIASALIWWQPTWAIADPICTFIFSIFVLFTTLSILKEALNVLMEGTPIGIDARALQEDLLLIPGVVEVHDLHVWSLSVGRPSLACHLVVANEDDARSVLRKATILCQRKYSILHTTVQTDFSADKRSCETAAHQKCSDRMKVFDY